MDLSIDTPTLTATTPSGGYHMYFRHPRTAIKAKLDGVDMKGGDGSGYVLAPPSTLPEGAYAWKDAEFPVAEFPKHLIDELRADGRKKPATASAVTGPVASIKTPQGRRHDRLVELGAVYRGKGLSEDEIETLLWSHAERYFEPPFSRKSQDDVREIEGVVRHFIGKDANVATLKPLTPITTMELRRRAKIHPAPALLDPILPEAGSLMIYGSAGVGKSHFGLCIAGALATGVPFLDWLSKESVRVLYVDGEMPLNELDNRIAQYFGDAPLDNLTWIAARAQEADLPNLADSAAQELYTAAVTAAGAKVAIFDNLSCLRSTSSEAPENSVEAWQPVGAFIWRLNRLGVAVVVIHHAAKTGGQRGSTAHVAPMDTVIALRSPGEGQSDPLAENDIEIVFDKHRRFGGDAAATFRAKAIGDPDDRVQWQRCGNDPLVDAVVRLRTQGVSVREIARQLNRATNAIQKAIKRAQARGLLPLKNDE